MYNQNLLYTAHIREQLKATSIWHTISRRFVKNFLESSESRVHTIRKHFIKPTRQLFTSDHDMLSCNNDSNNKISLVVYYTMAECSREDPEHFDYLGYFLTIWVIALSKQLIRAFNNSHRTIKLWFNEEKWFAIWFQHIPKLSSGFIQ